MLHLITKSLINLELAARQDKSTTLPNQTTRISTHLLELTLTSQTLASLKQALGCQLVRFVLTTRKLVMMLLLLSIYDVYDKPTGIGSVPYFSLPNTKNNAALKSERSKSYEVGVEASFLQDRIGFDVTLLQNKHA